MLIRLLYPSEHKFQPCGSKSVSSGIQSASAPLSTTRRSHRMTSTDHPDRTRWIALYVLCAGVLMIVLDATIVNVALPSIQARPRLLAEQPRVGRQRVPDRVRRPAAARRPARRPDRPAARLPRSAWPSSPPLQLLCAIAQTQEMLIGARFIQGVGGALTSAVMLGMIVTMFPEPREQAKAIGVYGFVASAGGSIGLLAGGVLTDLINWHWIFFINLPVGIATAFFALRLIEPGESLGPAPRRRHPRRGAADRRPDARRLHDPAGRASRAGARAARSASARSPSPRWSPSSSASRASTTR